MSWQAAIVRWAIRQKTRQSPPGPNDVFGVKGGSDLTPEAYLQKVRSTLDELVSSLPGPMRGTSIVRIDHDRIQGEWIVAPKVPKNTKRAILYCHGGGYFWGNLSAPRNMLARLSDLANARVFSLDYRLAPEAPFPAALDDALAAYSWLTKNQGIDRGQLIVGGDSAGGGLALSLLAALKKGNQAGPKAAFLFSPWADLSVSGPSIETNSKSDPVVTGADLRWSARLYLNDKNEDNSLASPLFSDLSDLPPILVQVGSTETLLDDARRLDDAVRDVGGRCRLEIWPHMHHVWQLHSFFLPEGRNALAQVAQFIDDTLTSTKA